MNKLLITVLALLSASAAVAEEKEATLPLAGNNYYLYNVGAKKYLGVDDNGKTVLSDTPREVTLETVEGAKYGNFYRLKFNDSTLGADLWGAPSVGGKYNEWRIERTPGYAESYIIASRNTEASASMYLYQNSIYDRLAAMPQMPRAEFEAAQWKFLTIPDTPETAIEEIVDDNELNNAGKTATGVYNLQGQQVGTTPTATKNLQNGVYVVNGKKVLKK